MEKCWRTSLPHGSIGTGVSLHASEYACNSEANRGMVYSWRVTVGDISFTCSADATAELSSCVHEEAMDVYEKCERVCRLGKTVTGVDTFVMRNRDSLGVPDRVGSKSVVNILCKYFLLYTSY